MRVRRRRLALAGAALGALLASLLLTPASPAQAVPVPVPVSATSPVNAGSPKVAIATCPAGLSLYGAGGTINGGAGNVVVSDVIPGPNSVTVWGIEANAFGGNWSVTAYAICGPFTGNVIVTAVTPFNGVAQKSVAAACPAGASLFGTGYELLGANGQVFPSGLVPNAGLTNVTASAVAQPGFGGNWSLRVYGICAAPTGFMQLVAASTPATPASPKGIVTPMCPGAANVHGVGAQVSGAGLGEIILQTIAPGTGALVDGEAVAVESAPVAGNWAVTSYAICSA